MPTCEIILYVSSEVSINYWDVYSWKFTIDDSESTYITADMFGRPLKAIRRKQQNRLNISLGSSEQWMSQCIYNSMGFQTTGKLKNGQIDDTMCAMSRPMLLY